MSLTDRDIEERLRRTFDAVAGAQLEGQPPARRDRRALVVGLAAAVIVIGLVGAGLLLANRDESETSVAAGERAVAYIPKELPVGFELESAEAFQFRGFPSVYVGPVDDEHDPHRLVVIRTSERTDWDRPQTGETTSSAPVRMWTQGQFNVVLVHGPAVPLDVVDDVVDAVRVTAEGAIEMGELPTGWTVRWDGRVPEEGWPATTYALTELDGDRIDVNTWTEVPPGFELAVLSPVDAAATTVRDHFGYVTEQGDARTVWWVEEPGTVVAVRATGQLADEVLEIADSLERVDSEAWDDFTNAAPAGVSGESDDAPGGDAAIWEIDETDPPSRAASSFTAMVSRLGCSSGRTGNVNKPFVSVQDDKVIVTMTVEPLDPDKGYECPSNDRVPVEVQLDQPLGTRQLLDGACLEGPAVGTSFCTNGPIRWPN